MPSGSWLLRFLSFGFTRGTRGCGGDTSSCTVTFGGGGRRSLECLLLLKVQGIIEHAEVLSIVSF